MLREVSLRMAKESCQEKPLQIQTPLVQERAKEKLSIKGDMEIYFYINIEKQILIQRMRQTEE